MKIIILATWVLVASAATEHIHNGIAISSGYGGAYGYVPIHSVKNTDEDLQSSDDISSGFEPNGIPIKNVVNVDNYLQPSAISSGYGGAYGYTNIPSVIDVNKSLKIDKTMLAFSSAYGGAYSYTPQSIVTTNNGLQFIADNLKGYSRAFSFSPLASIVSDDNGLQSGVAISSGYGGAYGYDVTSSNDVINTLKKLEMVKNVHLVMSVQHVMPFNEMVNILRSSQGFSGYGSGISSHSGYSRYPGFVGFGFAYANGWL